MFKIPKKIIFGHLKLEIGIYLGFGNWNLEFERMNLL
jgi:hypothetical protein